MLAALLLNPPTVASGPERGYATAGGTSWNKDWAKVYGPEARRKIGDKEFVKKAVEEIRIADFVPPELERAKEIVHSRSLVDELNDYKPDTKSLILYILQAYFVFLDWRKRDDEAIAVALLMME